MARLVLVGLGLGPRGIPLRGLETAREADAVFLETYTARAADDVAQLEALVGRPVTPVGRAAVEDGAALLDAAARGTCVLLVPGDPLSATTHTSLRLQAAKRGVPCDIVPAASIVAAAFGLLGLSGYKAGRSTTLVFPRRGFAPESPFDVVAANRVAGLHTLVLLDITDDPALVGPPGGVRCMSAAEGARILLETANRRGDGALDGATGIGVVARAGHPDGRTFFGALQNAAGADFGPPMHAIVVPGRMSDDERSAVAALCAPMPPARV